MTTPTGQISMSQIRLEIYGSATGQISLTDSNVRTLSGDTSGAVSMSDCKGKTWGGGGGGATFTPSANGTYGDSTVYPQNAGYILSCSEPALWTYTGGSGIGASESIASGTTATSITFTLTAGSGSSRSTTWNVTGSAGGVTRTYTIQLNTSGTA